MFDIGQGRKTDAHDAHAVVMVAVCDRGLREVTVDADLQVLRLLCDRRDALSRAHETGLLAACGVWRVRREASRQGRGDQ